MTTNTKAAPKFHLWFLRDVLPYIEDKRNPYGYRLQAAYTVQDWIINDSLAFDRDELQATISSMERVMASGQMNLLWSVALIIHIEADKLMSAFEDEYDGWLDDIATWRYDMYEDEYKASLR